MDYSGLRIPSNWNPITNVLIAKSFNRIRWICYQIGHGEPEDFDFQRSGCFPIRSKENQKKIIELDDGMRNLPTFDLPTIWLNCTKKVATWFEAKLKELSLVLKCNICQHWNLNSCQIEIPSSVSFRNYENEINWSHF